MHEFHGFQRDIRPELFYSAFESLLILIRTNKRSADSFIGKFSRVYRYIIEGKKQELIEVRRELEHLDNLLYLLNKKFNNKITLDIDIATSFMNYNLIPCSLQLVIEEAVFSNVIAEHSPMVLKLKSGDNNLMVSYTSFPRLLNDNKSEDMFRMNRAFDYYTNRKIESFSENGEVKIFIPILNLSEMEYIE
jgi:LytS/YehU family sensor histidine kinase